MSSLPSAQAVPRWWPRRLPGIVATLAPLLVVATLGILWGRSVRVQDWYAWHWTDTNELATILLF